MSDIAYICSPYGGKEENVEKARRYMRFMVRQGFVPVAPHVMLHGIMDDNRGEHRQAAMAANIRLLDACDVLCIFGDRITAGMQIEIEHAEKTKKQVLKFRLSY